jgi:hypothetical protein
MNGRVARKLRKEVVKRFGVWKSNPHARSLYRLLKRVWNNMPKAERPKETL